MKTNHFARLLSMLLCFCMILGLFPVSAFATEDENAVAAEHVHAGGAATCAVQAVCECGEPYGELAAHTPSEDGTVCTVCEASLVEEVAEPSEVETEPSEPEATEVSGGVITVWNWIDEYEVVDPETNIFTVISGSEENLISFDTVVEVLPTAINATVDGTEVVVELGDWSCAEYPENGVYYGYWTFKTALPEGFTLAADCEALELQVYFDESAGTFDNVSAGGNQYDINSSASTDNYYSLISKKDWELAPGITESQIVLNNSDGSYRQVLFVMEADLSNEYVKVVNSYTGMVPEYGNYNTGIMSQQAATAEKLSYGNVVGAMNTCLSWYTNYPADRVGEPLGFIMLDAKILFDPANCGYAYGNVGFPSVLVINKDFDENGNPRPADIPKVEMPQIKSAADLDGWEDQVIPASSGYILKDGVNQSKPNHTDAAPRSVVGIKPDGTVVIMVNDGRQSPYSAGMSMYELAEVMLDLGCTYAVNCDGGGSTTWVSERPGEEMQVNNSPSDGAERPTTTGILFITTAPATGDFARATITSPSEYYVPGCTVEFEVLGTDLVGTPAEIPEEVTWQIAEEDMGSIEKGVFTSNGTAGTVTAQMVYNDKVVGQHEIKLVVPESIRFGQSIMTIPYGKEVSLAPIATINGGLNEVALGSGDITFSFTNETLGTLNGFMFTSVSETTENNKGTVIATLNCDSKLTATAEMVLGKGSEVLFDFETDEDLDCWNIADVNGNDRGFVQELSIASGEDGQVHDGEGSLRLYMNPVAAPGISNGGYAQSDLFLDDPVIVENAKSIGFWAYIPDEYEHCWIRVLYWYDPDGDGKFDKKNTVSVINQPEVYNNMSESGWKYFSVDVSAYSKIMIAGVSGKDQIAHNASKNNANNFRFIEFMFPHTNTNELWKTYGTINGPQTVYIDNITADFSDAVDDREAPIFNKVSLTVNDTPVELKNNSIQTTSSNNLSVVAEVVEDTKKTNATGLNTASAKAYVDGIEVPCSFGKGKMSIADVVVANGVHRVKFEVADNMGNKAVVVRLIKVNSGVDASTVQLVPKNAALDSLYGGSVYWMDLKATDIETVQSVSMRVDLNSLNHWELDHTEYAPGFTGSYSIDEENNAANITISRTGTNTQTGDAVIASLPIRILSFETDIHVEDYTAETYWNDYGFWPYDLKVDVDMGKITYVEGHTATVLNGFSNEEFSVDTELQTAFSNPAFKTERGTAHVHTATAVEDKAATCLEAGYSGRTFCEVCQSVVSWGTIKEATGHDWKINAKGKLACANNPEELFTGTYEGKDYVDGVTAADGWIEVDGVKTAYYKDGVKLTGSHMIDGVMCTFDENGAYLPDYIYEGFYEVGDTVMYFLNNSYSTGYTRIANKPYYFDENGLGYDGEFTIGGELCVFDDGLFASCENTNVLEAGWTGDNITYIIYSDGHLAVNGDGDMWNYSMSQKVAPWAHYSQKHVKTIFIGNGITHVGAYSFRNCFLAHTVTFEEGSKAVRISNGAFSNIRQMTSIIIPDSVRFINNSVFESCFKLTSVYLPDAIADIHPKAFVKCPEELVLSVGEGSYAETFAKENGISYTTRVHEVKNGIYNENGAIYYYENDVKTAAGLVMVDGYYYYASTNGVCKTGKYWVSRPNDLLPAGYYFFDEETGRMEIKNGVYPEDGGVYYYVNDVRTAAGLVKVGDDYYYASTGGECKTGKYWVSRTNGLLPAGYYFFDETTAKLTIKNGIYAEDGGIYYYVDGSRTAAGLIKVDGYYYYASTDGVCKTGKYWVSRTNDLLPAGYYFFDLETARMDIKNGVYAEDGGIYYYVDGVRTAAGLVEVDGDYYYASTGGVCKTGKYWVSRPNGLMDAGYYTFGEDGKMIR